MSVKISLDYDAWLPTVDRQQAIYSSSRKFHPEKKKYYKHNLFIFVVRFLFFKKNEAFLHFKHIKGSYLFSSSALNNLV